MNCVSKSNNDIYSLYNKIEYENLPSLTKSLAFFDNVKDETLKPKKLITDTYFKGIGILLENNYVLFTSNFGIEEARKNSMELTTLNNVSLMNFETLKLKIKTLNKEVQLEKQKLNIKIKKIEKSDMSSSVMSIKINTLLNKLNNYPKEINIQNVIINENKVVAAVLNNGLFHPLKKEEYKPDTMHKMKVDPLQLNYYLNIDLEDSTVSNESVSFNYTYYRNLDKYSCFKNQFKGFFISKNRHLRY